VADVPSGPNIYSTPHICELKNKVSRCSPGPSGLKLVASFHMLSNNSYNYTIF
jgi:hypothetical protein